MSHDLFVFDIPHIADEIASHLDRKDYASCKLVSKDLCEIFNPFLWSQLSIQDPVPLDKPRITTSHEQTLTNNVQWTRGLSIDTGCHQDVLRILCSGCHRLRSIDMRMSKKNEHWDEDSLSQVLPLLSNNPYLQKCAIHTFADFTRGAFAQLTRTMATSSHLTDLKLVLTTQSRSGWLGSIIQNLPLTLRRLHLQRVRQLSTSNEYDYDYVPTDCSPESYPCLEFFAAVFLVTSYEVQPFMQFLKKCPSLKEFTMPQTELSDTFTDVLCLFKENSRFPRLDTLDMCRIGEIADHQWCDLVVGMKDRIKTISIDQHFRTISKALYIPVMTKLWSHTLEFLKLDDPSGISSQDVQRILTTCAKLKTFDCLCLWLLILPIPPNVLYESLPGLSATELLRDTNDGDDGVEKVVDWVCLDLEDLKLTFSNPYIQMPEESVMSDLEQRTIQGIKGIYQQLGRLTKLKSLSMGWCSATAMLWEDANLDMSLRSGLEHMQGLKSLRTIDLTWIQKVNFGVAEVHWILENWPALTEMNGLRYRYLRKGPSEEDPEYITLLCSGRPGLVVA
ncbi:hypothetical protein BGX31_001973 [Mortierella sp. GBA43]|nr:hypothetical protein BGX31_001973 [Mortierella sp. GBA43]